MVTFFVTDPFADSSRLFDSSVSSYFDHLTRMTVQSLLKAIYQIQNLLASVKEKYYNLTLGGFLT